MIKKLLPDVLIVIVIVAILTGVILLQKENLPLVCDEAYTIDRILSAHGNEKTFVLSNGLEYTMHIYSEISVGDEICVRKVRVAHELKPN